MTRTGTLGAALLLALAALTGCPDGSSSSSGTAPEAARNDPPAAALVASKNGDVYHLPSCKKAQEISAENRVEYATPGKARSAGKRRCKECSPP